MVVHNNSLKTDNKCSIFLLKNHILPELFHGCNGSERDFVILNNTTKDFFHNVSISGGSSTQFLIFKLIIPNHCL